MTAPTPGQPLVIACGALAGDLRAVLAESGLASSVDVHYLPAGLHNRPDRIVPELRPVLDAAVADRREVFVAYADCGTGGLLDVLLADFPAVHRLPGAHCYEFFAGHDVFAAMHERRLGTFYLTDFLAKHFDALIWRGLGMDRAPELREMYFGNYTTVVLLAQTDDPAITRQAMAAAERLGLDFERHVVGRGGLGEPVEQWAQAVGLPGAAWSVGLMVRRSTANQLTVITWRDIPAQVNGGSDDDKHQRILPQRFQGAIDRAAMKAGKKTAGEYVAEWRKHMVRLPADFDGDYGAACIAEAQRLEDAFPVERLKLWIETGGWDPDRPEHERI